MMLATWNVRSLYRPGALAKLKDELNKYGIAITDIWTNKGKMDSGELKLMQNG
jgi:hypothetical protein